MSELKDILEVNDFSVGLETATSLPKKPSQAQIEAVLAENGIVNPVSSVKFFIRSIPNGRVFQVNYASTLFKYLYILLDEAV